MSLQIKNISKIFDMPGGAKYNAVTGLNLQIPQGKFVTLLGPSGCGKTTLLRIIAGFETPTVGQIVYDGKNLTSTPPHERGFPMVFQSYALFPHMTVKENIGYGLKIRKMAKSEIEKKVSQFIELLDLTPHSDKYPHQMSGGQQQRVALARALVLEPRIILFDEPLSNLDAKLRVFMREEIRRIQLRLGLTAIYVTHDQEEAMAISDIVVVMNKGQVEQIGSPEQIYHRPSTEFVARFMGNANLIPARKVEANRFVLFNESYEFVEEGRAQGQGATTVVVRPECVRVSREKLRHAATVKRSSFLGASLHYTLDCGPQTLSAMVAWDGRSLPFSDGEKVFFEIDVRNAHIL